MRHLLFLLSCGVLATSFAQAGTITYEMLNHPNGAAAQPHYGLRLDGLYSGNSSHIWTFDFEDSRIASNNRMQLVYDDVADSLTISGQAWGGLDIGSSYDPSNSGLWEISFVYADNVTEVFDAGQFVGYRVTAESGNNRGYVQSLFTSGVVTSGDTIGMTDEQGSHKYSFQFVNNSDSKNNGGIAGNPNLFSANGWMNHSINPIDLNQWNNQGHIYSSDWLSTGTIGTPRPVPEPASAAIFACGALGLLFRRKRA